MAEPSSRFNNIILLLLILVVAGGLVWWGDSVGLLDISGISEDYLGKIPYVGGYFGPPPVVTIEERRQVERLQAEAALTDREEALAETEERLRGIEDDLNDERSRLAQWEEELERREEALALREEEARDEESLYNRLVAYYTSMRPVDAANILAQQDDLLVIEIFRRMPERNVASILREMDPTVAATILRKMTR